MPRTCFVIMPFSSTSSCTEEQWTQIFEEIFKPAVEGAGLDYECRRSEATRGNIVAGIVRDLNDSYVVLADLTDRNPNVFYEMGVRHALKNRSILIAQRREDIPFDLKGYASHVYEWRTEEGKAELTQRLRQLLQDIDTDPERADNPVRDFIIEPDAEAVPGGQRSIQDTTAMPPLVGPIEPGINVVDLTRTLAEDGSPRRARAVLRQTRQALISQMSALVESLNKEGRTGGVSEKEIAPLAAGYISQVEPLIVPLEEFALTAIEEDWQEGVTTVLELVGDLITLSEKPKPGRSIRFAQGTPALLAWRLVLLMGSKAFAEENYNLLALVLHKQIKVEDSADRFSHRSFLNRLGLFHPEAFLGYADHAVKYMIALWDTQPHLDTFFGSKADYHLHLARFLMVMALADGLGGQQYPLYPGYRLIPDARRAMSALCSRLAEDPVFLGKIAQVIGETEASLKERWPQIVAQANEAQLGGGYMLGGVRFPRELKGEVKDL